MYTCHLCDLKTKQLNGLMSRHYKKHCNESYSSAEYKKDLLVANNRPIGICKVCLLETAIPKGEKEYPDYHKHCYTKNMLQGSNNPNFEDKLISTDCAHCTKTLAKYKTQSGANSFCCASCSTSFYSKLENQSEQKKIAVENSRIQMRELQKTDGARKASAEARAKLQKDRVSSGESIFIEKLREKFPDIEQGKVFDFYTVDAWIPSLSVIIEYHGNYWHNKDNPIDKRKESFFKNNHPDKEYLIAWESEANDISMLDIDYIRKDFDVVILCGPNGVGKTWTAGKLKEDYNIVDYDTFSGDIDKLLDGVKEGDLIVTPIRAPFMAKQLRLKGFRVKLVVMQEDEDVVEHRLLLRGGQLTDSVRKRIKRYESIKNKSMFFGTQDEVLKYLSK